jgi:DNA gyrase subunit B
MRSRPGMYIGGLNARGLGYLVDGIIEDLLGASGSKLTSVWVTLDTGRSLALEITGEVRGLKDLSACAETNPLLEAASDGPPNPYPFLGFPIAAAFSSCMELEVVQPDFSWRQRVERGAVIHPVEQTAFIGPARISLRLQPDSGLFPPQIEPSFFALCANMQEHAVTHAGARFSVIDATTGTRRDFQYPLGLRDYLAEIDPLWSYSHIRVYHLAHSEGGESAEAVIFDSGVGPGLVHTFVNGRRCIGGGSHVEGLAAGIGSVLSGRSESAFRFNPGEPLAGKTIILSVRLREPEWAGATKTVLAGTRPASLVREIVVKRLPAQMEHADGTPKA